MLGKMIKNNKYSLTTISKKISAIYLINIFYIIVLIGAMMISYNIVNNKYVRLDKYNEQNSASSQLNNLLFESSAEILQILYDNKDDIIPVLFARNEDIFNLFEQFKSTAEKYEIESNVEFAKKNEGVILELRSNVVACINLYRNKKVNEAKKFYNQKIDASIKKISQFVSDSISSNKSSIEIIRKEIVGTEWFVKIMLGASVVIIIGINVLFGTLLKRSILKPIKSLVNMLKDARGDLTVNLDLNSKDELGEMAGYFNNFVRIIHDLVVEVIFSAENLSTAVEQISVGNKDLSNRSAEQASSLEEIASTLEQAAATITMNAENAQLASNFTSETTKVASEGKDIVLKSAESINELKKSSKRIGEIISVINNITFQTNLLSLNAAIEAARAGESGKGFAVVAREVRNLAQGSSNAAKEIENLIQDAVNKMEIGAEFANRSTEALLKIVEAINKVGHLMIDISTTSKEQKLGIDQINIAVSEMDNFTQQNSSLAEETAAASEGMSKLAQDLLYKVRQFKINEAAGA